MSLQRSGRLLKSLMQSHHCTKQPFSEFGPAQEEIEDKIFVFYSQPGLDVHKLRRNDTFVCGNLLTNETRNTENRITQLPPAYTLMPR